MSNRKKAESKTFIFPENVESSYGVFLGLTVKELIIYVLPVVAVCIVFIAIPPHSLTFMIIKLIIAVLLLTIVLAVLSSKPVSSRNNVRLTQYLKMKSKYTSRQKLFFKEKTKLK